MNYKWDEARIQALIDGRVEEGATLDYKAAGSLGTQNDKTAEITKDVSAFANAGGGIIIYGVRQFKDKEREHRPETLDAIDRTVFGKEWLDHIIGTIQPRLKVRIESVQLSSHENHVAYVIEIPQSETAHQATDGKYYQRQNFERPFMRDYQIRDVMRRRKHPAIKVEVRIIIGKHGWTNRVWWRISNTSEIFARYVMLELSVPVCIRKKMIGFNNGDGVLKTDDETGSLWRLRASNSMGRPLFPQGDISREFGFSFAASITNGKGEPLTSSDKTHFKVFADEMPPIEGSLETETLITISDYDKPPK